MAEWSNAAASKAVVPLVGTGGSNPSLSATDTAPVRKQPGQYRPIEQSIRMTTDDLLAQLGFCHFCIITNLEEVTEAQALQEPKPSGNPVNYVLGHIVAYRTHVCKILEVKHPWNDAKFSVYDESWPKTDKAKLLSLAKLKADEEQTHAILKAGIENFAIDWDDLWPQRKEGSLQTYGRRVQFFLQHEAYHAGQLGSLRRSLGLPGKI